MKHVYVGTGAQAVQAEVAWPMPIESFNWAEDAVAEDARQACRGECNR